jgi:cytochrome bd-type quinol oxidase subunit 1
MRKFVLLTHILSSVSWIGVDLVMGVLSFRGLTTDDPQTLATSYGALAMFCVPLLLTLGLLSLGTGVVLGLGTRFGLLRHWWVVTKLVIAVILCTLVLVALRPALLDAATQTAVVDGTLADRLSVVRRDMIFPPIVSTSALLFASWLAVYKPWGLTPRGRRFLRVRGSERRSARPSGEPGLDSVPETSPHSPLAHETSAQR